MDDCTPLIVGASERVIALAETIYANDFGCSLSVMGKGTTPPPCLPASRGLRLGANTVACRVGAALARAQAERRVFPDLTGLCCYSWYTGPARS